MPAQGLSFGSNRQHYVQTRMPYPQAAINFITASLPSQSPIVELGAGTGLASIALARRGYRIIAVEPDAVMAAGLSGKTGIIPLRAYAENTGLAAHCTALILCAQSFHWFDKDAALNEIRRLLIRDGVLVILWKSLDRSDETSARFSRFRNNVLGPPLEKVRQLTLDHFLQFGFHPIAEATFAQQQQISAQNIFEYLSAQRNHRGIKMSPASIIERFTQTFDANPITIGSDINIMKFAYVPKALG